MTNKDAIGSIVRLMSTHRLVKVRTDLKYPRIELEACGSRAYLWLRPQSIYIAAHRDYAPMMRDGSRWGYTPKSLMRLGSPQKISSHIIGAMQEAAIRA